MVRHHKNDALCYICLLQFVCTLLTFPCIGYFVIHTAKLILISLNHLEHNAKFFIIFMYAIIIFLLFSVLTITTITIIAVVLTNFADAKRQVQLNNHDPELSYTEIRTPRQA